jgi:hypothetical protein
MDPIVLLSGSSQEAQQAKSVEDLSQKIYHPFFWTNAPKVISHERASDLGVCIIHTQPRHTSTVRF